MAKQKNYYIGILSKALLSYRKRTGYTQAEMSTFLNDGKPAATGTYTNIERQSRKAGFVAFRKMARYFLKVKDTKMVKALLEYANLNPKQLHQMLDAETWHLLPKLPESNRLIQFIFKGAGTEAGTIDTFDMGTGIYSNGKLWRFQGAWIPRDATSGININKIYTWRYLDEAFAPAEPSPPTAFVAEAEAGEVAK